MENKKHSVSKGSAFEEHIRKNSRFYLVTLFLAVIILALMCIGNSIWNEYRNSAVQNQKDQMLLAVESLSGRLEETIDEYAADIRSLWNCSHSLDENEQEALWDTYVEEHGPVVQDVIIKKKGETILTAGTDDEPEEILSESRIDSQMCFRLVKIGNKNHYLMLYYETDTGETISMILNGMAYYNRTMRPLNVGTNGYFVLKDHNGIVLMHPQAEQWGIDVIHGREKMFPGKNLTSLNTMIDRQKQGLTAVDEYYSYWWTKPGAPGVEKVSAYTPAYIRKGFHYCQCCYGSERYVCPTGGRCLETAPCFHRCSFYHPCCCFLHFPFDVKEQKRPSADYLFNGIKRYFRADASK